MNSFETLFSPFVFNAFQKIFTLIHNVDSSDFECRVLKKSKILLIFRLKYFFREIKRRALAEFECSQSLIFGTILRSGLVAAEETVKLFEQIYRIAKYFCNL